MLSHQRWPYVGRFARGWHRLPGRIPGQPQTRTRARWSLGSPARTTQRRPAPRDRPGSGDRVDLRRPGLAQDVGSRRHRRPGREDIIDQQHARRTRAARTEHPVHRHPAFGAGAPRLRRRRDRTPELPPRRTLETSGERNRQRTRLVEATLGATAARERHPRDDVDVGDRAGARDRAGEGRGDVTPSRELQTKHRPSCRTV